MNSPKDDPTIMRKGSSERTADYSIKVTFQDDSSNKIGRQESLSNKIHRSELKAHTSLSFLSPIHRPDKERNISSIDEMLISKTTLPTLHDTELPGSQTLKIERTSHEKRLSSFLLTLQPLEGVARSYECSPVNSPRKLHSQEVSQASLLDEQVLSDSSFTDSEDEQKSKKIKKEEDDYTMSSAFEEEEDYKTPKSKFSQLKPQSADRKSIESGGGGSTDKKSFTFTVSKYFSKFKGLVGGIIKRSEDEIPEEDEEEYKAECEERPEYFVSVVPGLQETEIDKIDIEQSVKFQATRMSKSLQQLISTLSKFSFPSMSSLDDTFDDKFKMKATSKTENGPPERFDLDEVTIQINKDKKNLRKLIPSFTERLRKKHKIWSNDLIKLDKLSEGPYADTWRVYDKKRKEFYGLKHLRKSRGWTLSSFELQVLRELEIYVSLYNRDDEDLLQIFALEHDHEKNEYSIVFELGYGTLRNFAMFMHNSGIEWSYDLVGGLCQSVGNQVSKLKQMSITHKDIKEENIIITKSGQLKLADFSCASKVDKIGHSQLSVCGTPYYMPPELRLQWQNKGATYNYDPFRADVYSIATMLTILLMKNTVRPEDQMPEMSSKYGAQLHDLIQNMMMQREIPPQLKQQSFRKIIIEQSSNYEKYYKKRILEKFVKSNRTLDEPKLLKYELFEDIAEKMLKSKIKLAENLKNKSEVAKFKLHLAMLLKEQNEIADCIEILSQIRGKIPRTDRVLNYYRIRIKAELYYGQQRYEKAMKEFMKLQDFYTKYFSEKDLKMAHTLKDIGLSLKQQGRYDKAYKYLAKSAQIFIEQLGSEHIDVADILELVGLTLEHRGKYLDALRNYQKSMKRFVDLYGKTHPRVGQLYGRLGTVSLRQKNYEEALANHRKALEIHQAHSGPLSADVAGMFGHIATVYRHQEEFQDALKNYFKAIEIYLKHGGNYQSEISTMCEHVAYISMRMKRYEDALPYSLKALEMKRELHKDIHPDVATTFCLVGQVYLKLKKNRDALQNYLNALEIEKRLNGEEHIKVAKVLYRIATIYREKKNYEAAIKNFLTVTDIYAMYYEECKADLAKTFSNVARIYELQNQTEDAINNYSEAAELFKKSKGDKCIEYAIQHSRLGSLQIKRGNVEQALKSYRITLDIYKEVYGESSQKTVKYLDKIAELLAKQGNLKQAYESYGIGVNLRLDQIVNGKQKMKVKKFVSKEA